ncbi:hypothetical protein A4A49_61693, partial [Nicotiana attenuata]
PLCNQQDETISHMFFECEVTSEIWGKMLEWQGIQRQALSWKDELAWAVMHYNGKNPKSEICRMVLAGTVYHVWMERNQRVLRQTQRSTVKITKMIVQEVFYRASKEATMARTL